MAAAGLPDARGSHSALGCHLQPPFPLGVPGWCQGCHQTPQVQRTGWLPLGYGIRMAYPNSCPQGPENTDNSEILPILFLDFFCLFFFFSWTMLVTCLCWEAPWCVNQKYTKPTWPPARAPQSLSCHRADSVDPPPASGLLAKTSPHHHGHSGPQGSCPVGVLVKLAVTFWFGSLLGNLGAYSTAAGFAKAESLH